MKKLTAFLLAAALSVAMLMGCGAKSDKPQAAPVDVDVLAMKGPTAIGMVKMMDDAKNGAIKTNNYNFSIVAAVDEVAPKLVKGEVDIAAVPANLASVLYNNTKGEVSVLAINTLGILYIAQSGDSVSSVADLKGKTIYASGKGATPEYALNYILSANGIDPTKDVTIEWKSEHSECVAAMAKGDDVIAMLPQPFLTTAMLKNDKIRPALDLTKEWEKLQENEETKSAMLTGVVVARKAFVDEHPDVVADFLENYEASVKFVNEDVEASAALTGQFDIVPEAVAKKAIPQCNIVYIDGSEMKASLSGYLKVLMDQNPKAVGGALPADDFYYSR